MTFKTAYIQQPTPAKRGSRAGDFASDLASLGLHSGQHGFDGGRNGDAERFSGATLGAGERKDAILEIHAIQRDLCLTQAAARSHGDLKADLHPFGDTWHSESLSYDFDLILRKDRFNPSNRRPLNSVIKQSDRVHLSKQSALPMNPLQHLQIRARLVATSLAAGRAGKALSPFQINFTIGCRKRLQGNFFLTNKSRQMTPAIPVINFCQRGNGMIFDQIINPFAPAISALFVHANSSGLGRCLRAMQRVVDSVAGAFTAPLARWVFGANKEPWRSFLNVRIGHSYKGNIYSV